MRRCLKLMAEREDEHRTVTKGTVVWLEMVSELHLAHFGKKLSLRKRTRIISCVLNSMRLWRIWVKACPRSNLDKNFHTRECFQDTLIEMCGSLNSQHAIAKYSPELPSILKNRGSNDCERTFADSLGGHGLLDFHAKHITYLPAVRNLEKKNTLLSLEAKRDVGGVEISSSQRRKSEFLNACHEDMTLPDADLYAHPTEVETIEDLNTGLAQAQKRMELAGLKAEILTKFGNAAWNEPWTLDLSWTGEMLKDADLETPGDCDDPPPESGTAAAEAPKELPVENEIPLEMPPDVAELALLVAEAADVVEAHEPEELIPISMSVSTPKGRFAKASIVSRHRKCQRNLVKMDFGRLRKIAENGKLTAVKAERQNAEDASVLTLDMSEAEQSMQLIAPGDFVALAFEGKGSDSVWMLKIVRMHYDEEITVKKTGGKRKRRAEERKAVSLSAPRSKTLTLMGTWLTPVEGKKNRYSHDDQATAMDPTANVPFPISAYLGHCDVGYDPEDHLFLLRDPSQMTRFQEDAKAVQPECKRTRTVDSVRRRVT
jgi:hypothetical protein